MVSRFDLCRGDPMTVEKRKRDTDAVRKLQPSAKTYFFKWGTLLSTFAYSAIATPLLIYAAHYNFDPLLVGLLYSLIWTVIALACSAIANVLVIGFIGFFCAQSHHLPLWKLALLSQGFIFALPAAFIFVFVDQYDYLLSVIYLSPWFIIMSGINWQYWRIAQPIAKKKRTPAQ